MAFFNINQYQRTKPRVSKITGCGLCKLNKSCDNPKMPAHGNGERRVMFIGEAPSLREDRRNQTMIGPPATFLRGVLSNMGWDLDEDCVKINAVCCCPNGEEPTAKQIEACRPHVLQEIEFWKPTVIIPLGESALKAVLGHRFRKELGGIHKWRGWAVPDRDFNAWICPTFHPAYLKKVEKKLPYADPMFRNDIHAALQLCEEPIPDFGNEKKSVKILHSFEEISAYLKGLIKNPPEYAAFDYETTGLKPHAKGHRIVSVSICSDENTAYSFLLKNRVKKLFTRFLKNRKIKKIAHHMKFEETWSRFILKTKVKNWYYDPMIGTHCLDNRPGITSLKFQAAVNFGLYDYDASIESFLKGDQEDNANSFNDIHKCDETELLLYNGIDSLVTYRLAMKQLNDKRMTWDGYDLLHEGSLELADAEANGMCVDVPYVKKQEKHLTRKIKYLEKKIESHEEIKKWRKVYRGKFNLNSDDQLSDILFNHFEYKSEIQTASGKPSVSQEALEQLDIPLVADLLYIRKLKKAKDTYLGNYSREEVDGILRPFFHLHTVRTFRSSSSRINFQNQPNRDKEIKKLTRTAIVPRKGRMICEIDYGGIEVKGATFYHKDPEMIDEILNPERDMHRDMAIECYMLDDDDWTREARQEAKNKFVFPEFYGDWFKSCAEGLWNSIHTVDLKTASGVPLKKNLAKHGIKTLEQFIDHIEAVEDRFWNKRFRTYGKWREKHYETYTKTGYVETLSGFRCVALMGRNDAINYPVQGVAFHCLLWSFIQMSKWLRENEMETKLIGQIHDSIVLDIEPSECNQVLAKAKEIMTIFIREHWDFINVPLEVEVELTPVDGSWYLKKEVVEHKCECQSEWMYKTKDKESKLIYWSCPMCDHTETEYEKQLKGE